MPKLQGREPVYSAGEEWKRKCLLQDGAMLSSDQTWTAANAAELVKRFIDRPDEGDRTFMQKLEKQLSDASPGATRLAAEMLWLMMLFPSNIGEKKKRSLVTAVWSWSGQPLDERHQALAPFAFGIGSGGPGYNQFRPFELMLVIRFVVAWKALAREQQNALLADGWTFANWFDRLPDAKSRQFRHMLLHLLFPANFERCASAGDKRKIERTFRKELPGGSSLGKPREPIDYDRRLRDIRLKFVRESGDEGVDFYTSEKIAARWRNSSNAVEATDGAEDAEDIDPVINPQRSWLIAAGENGSLRDQFLSEGEITIGWEKLGDLSRYKDEAGVREALQEHYDSSENPVNNVRACLNFAHEMRIGDEVYLKQGWRRIIARGRITGNYEYDPERSGHCHVRTVAWEPALDLTVPAQFRLPTKTLTDITTYTPLLRALRAMGRPSGSAEPVVAAPERYTVDDVMRDGFLERDQVMRILESLKRRKNVILQGPPGVGKTFLARRLAYAHISKKAEDYVESVQFHQSYAYEDFIQGFRPDANGKFSLRDGKFVEFCRMAAEEPDESFVFIIDEINRGNLSKIFGELLSLIEGDKRREEYAIPLTYAGENDGRFFVPDNVYLIGLMNTADRSLAMVDFALRRRFAFHDLTPQLHSPAFERHLLDKGISGDVVARIRQNVAAVNEAIEKDSKNLGAGYLIGHSYFCPTTTEPDAGQWYERIVHEELAPLLQEYWFDQPSKVETHLELLRR